MAGLEAARGGEESERGTHGEKRRGGEGTE